MGEYAIRRVLLFIPTLLVATVLVFTLFWIVPGDPALTILAGGEGDSGSVSQEQLQQLRQALGLDRPIYVQYGNWLWNVLRGDLGTSLWYKTPVWDQLKDRFLVTMELAVMAILLAFCVAVPLGVTSAVKQDTGFDYLSRIFSGIGIALPTFWLGILIVYALASFFQWLPPLGYATLWDDPLLNLQQLIFPALTLAFHDLAFTARVTRSSMLEVMREDYLRTARAKGMMEILVIGRHALKNALLPVVTISGYQFGRLLVQLVMIEYPILGRYGRSLRHDFSHRFRRPVKRVRMLIPFANKLAKLGLEVLLRFKVGDAQAFALEDAEPLFHLIHP
jgi:peptide/nickel transport system permease protein